MYFEIRTRALSREGNSSVAGKALSVRDTTSVTLLISAATDTRALAKMPDRRPEELSAICEQTLRAASARSYAELRQEHIQDHQSFFRRVSLSLGSVAFSSKPTDERLKEQLIAGEPAFAALYFQYARYLMIASSRRGTQPANLQGIWNVQMRPPWCANWTLNINAQMNYWLAGSG